VLAITVLMALLIMLAGSIWSIFRNRQTIDASASQRAEQNQRAELGHGMSWVAVETDNPIAVAQALGLRNTSHVSWTHGVEVIYDAQNSDRLIFVTPALDGWVLVAGHALPQPLGNAFADKCTPLIVALSKKFGEAQYFLSYPVLDFFGWAKAENGELIRAFASGDEGVVWNYGYLTASELELGLKHYEFRGLCARHGDAGGAMILIPTQAQVLALAARWSVHPFILSEQIAGDAANGVVGNAPVIWRSALLARHAA